MSIDAAAFVSDVVALLGEFVLHILQMRTQEEMLGVHAKRCVALVQNAGSVAVRIFNLWDFAVNQDPGHTMGAIVSTSKPKAAVLQFIAATACPRP